MNLKQKEVPVTSTKKNFAEVQQLNDWLIANRHSLKVTIILQRLCFALKSEQIVLPYFKKEVNRLLNRKFFAE